MVIDITDFSNIHVDWGSLYKSANIRDNKFVRFRRFRINKIAKHLREPAIIAKLIFVKVFHTSHQLILPSAVKLWKYKLADVLTKASVWAQSEHAPTSYVATFISPIRICSTEFEKTQIFPNNQILLYLYCCFPIKLIQN